MIELPAVAVTIIMAAAIQIGTLIWVLSRLSITQKVQDDAIAGKEDSALIAARMSEILAMIQKHNDDDQRRFDLLFEHMNSDQKHRNYDDRLSAIERELHKVDITTRSITREISEVNGEVRSLIAHVQAGRGAWPPNP